MNLTEYMILLALTRGEPRGNLRELAESLEEKRHPSHVYRSLMRLEQKGLVEFVRRGPSGRRRLWAARPTKRGLELLRRMSLAPAASKAR